MGVNGSERKRDRFVDAAYRIALPAGAAFGSFTAAMARDSYFLVYFSGALTLDHAEAALRKTSLTVHRSDQALEVHWGEGPRLWIGLNAEPHVKREAFELAEEKGVPELGRCDRRFEVAFDQLDEVLDETNTLAETQMVLQDLTHGWVAMAWNDEFLHPEAH